MPVNTNRDVSQTPSPASSLQMPSDVRKSLRWLDSSNFTDLFAGQLKSTLRCSECGHESTTLQPFRALSLPIPPKTGQVQLHACLDLFAMEETLDGEEKPACSECQIRQQSTKKLSIHKFPHILVLHLKRFMLQERSTEPARAIKVNTAVDFPESTLDLSPYSASQTSCQYSLYGVTSHSGTLSSGHYMAYCKHPHTGKWHVYDDSEVQSVSLRTVKRSGAYMLFFEQSNST